MDVQTQRRPWKAGLLALALWSSTHNTVTAQEQVLATTSTATAEPVVLSSDIVTSGLAGCSTCGDGVADVATPSPWLRAPNMLGDFAGIVFPSIPDPVAPPEPPGLTDPLRTDQSRALIRSVSRFKVADWNSPRPQTRIMYSYNYFQDAFGGPGDIHRNIAGVEVAFFNQRVSLDVRGGINSFVGYNASDYTGATDTRATLKIVGFDRGGLLLSGGLGLGFPTGQRPENFPSGSVYFAPYVAYLYASESLPVFVHGFQQIDLPEDPDDQSLLHTDVGIGFWLRRPETSTGFLAGIAPTAELHVYTPLGDPTTGAYERIIYRDVTNVTLGTTFILRNRATIGVGVSLPVSDEQDYNTEIQVHADWRF